MHVINYIVIAEGMSLQHNVFDMHACLVKNDSFLH